MFKKLLIANRGEIAVRIARACRELGILTVALYEAPDQGSLHVRLADEAVLLQTPQRFFDQEAILAIAKEKGVDAIHPGYGFLAENVAFVERCAAEGIVFVGPSAETLARLSEKVSTLQQAAAAGFPTVAHSGRSFGVDEGDELAQAARDLGFPAVLKSCSGGRGPGERLLNRGSQLERVIRRARSETQAYYGDQRLYLEKAILPAHQVGVQVIGDRHGNVIHLGEREGSIISRNRKIVEEAPAPCLTEDQRARLCQTAVEIARFFNYDNVGTVEFLVDVSGNFYFTEFKARLQVEHALTEMVSQVDLVQQQLRSAAGKRLALTQADVHLRGWSMMARLRAENPRQDYLPSPGRLDRVRFPTGPGIRVDTYVYCRSDVPAIYNALFAKLTVWAESRELCIRRMRCALEDTKVVGTTTNIPLLQKIVHADDFVNGDYTTDFLAHPLTVEPESSDYYRDLAAIAAVLYVRRNQMFNPTIPERFTGGWYRSSRRLPE